MSLLRLRRYALWLSLVSASLVLGHPFPGLWQNGTGAAIHYQPVQWPNEPVAASCGDSCGDWKPYTRFGRSINDPRVQDPSNGGTAPQNYVNVASSCVDKSKPSIYYYLYKASNPANDIVMFRWRVEQAAHNYATGPSAGNYSATSPWSSAQWTVLFNIDGSGYRSLAAHLNGSSGSPAEPVDMLAGIWSNTNNQSIDYSSDSNVHLLAHNPTAFIGPTNKLMNFHNSLSPDESWPNGAGETVWDYGTTRAELIATSPCNEYFIDYQIPVAMLNANGVGGPSITRDTPISMLFCTANSLSNPFQKDCAINRTWSANAAAPAPFGDYLSFNKDEPYAQPIVSSVTATAPQSCPGNYTLTTKIQDALAVQAGVVVPTIKTAQFYYWYDKNGDGQATAADTGSQWTRITPNASLVANTLNTFTASWDATSLPKGKYLIGVQAVDDSTLLDDNMTSTGVDNRTFSYLSGDANNKIYIAGAWQTGQQAIFPAHSPSQTSGSGENWFGNPSVTGMQVALVGTAINACGVAPTLTLNSSPASVAAGGTVNFTITVANPSQNSSAIDVSSFSDLLPTGFSYVNASSTGTGGLPSTNPTVSGQTLTWTLGSPLTLAPGSSATLSFAATASSTAGNYNSTASAVTSFGDLGSSPTSIVVDSARLSLAITPSAYSIAADGSTQLTYTLKYSNDSGVIVTSASISDVLPSGVTYVTCSGGTSCGNTAGTVTWSLGTLAGGASGTVTFAITVNSNYSTYSLTDSATLSATAPDSSTVTANASSTVAVTGQAGTTSPAFTLTNTASAASVAPGGSITYTLTYSNYGNGNASSVVLTDTLAAGTSFTSCTGSCSNGSGTATWNIGTVAAGASASVTVTVAVGSPFTSANPAVNSASLSWTSGTPVAATSSVGVTGQACSTYYYRNTTANVGFDGTKRIANVSPVPVAGDTGTIVAATAPVSGSAFLEVLRFYQDPQTGNDVPFNGNITSNIYIDRANGQGLNIRTTIYDYNSSTGGTTQLAQKTTLFNGSTKGLLTDTITPSGTLAKGHRLLWVYEARSNHASQTVQVEFQFGGTVTNGISGGTTFASSNAAYCVTPPAQLTLTNQASAASMTEGTSPTITYTLNYANIGSASATNTVLTAALPSGFTSCQYSTDNINWTGNTCSNVGSSPPYHIFSLGTKAGGATGTVYVRAVAPSSATGGSALTSTSSIASDQTSTLNASAGTQVIGSGVPGGTPALTLLLSANRTSATPGQSVIYTATVINTGSAAATNVVVSNTVPSFSYYTYSGCTGGCSNSSGTLTWPTISSLASGASQSVTYTMTTATSGLPAGVTVISDNLSATGASSLSATSNTVSVAVNGNPSLVLLDNASPSSGLHPSNTITYTLSVANSGAANASTVTVTNPIPANTSYSGNITASQGSGVFDPIANRVNFDVGTLASGATVTLTFDVLINSPLPSGNTTITGVATADSGNAAEQVASANASVSAAPVFALSKTAPTSVAYPSAVLTAAAAGTIVLVDRTDRLQLNQLVKIGNQVARITALSAKSIVVDSVITASNGAQVNGALLFTLAYSNTGNADATAVVLREPLAGGFAYYASMPSASSAPSAGSSGNVDWNIGTLGAGASGSVQILAFPSGSTGTFTDISTITSTNTPTATATSATQIGGLSVTKSSSTPVVSAGTTATYTIVISNSLGAPVTPVAITDKLPQGFTYHTSSATIGGNPVEPTFDASDSAHVQPTWGGLSIPAGASLSIVFQANVGANVGAGDYQNEVHADVPAGTGVVDFDPLLTTAEDVTVLAAASGVVKGYVFSRTSGNSLSYDPATDTPLASVRVEIHKSGADCANPVGGNCVVVYTNSDGYFEHTMAAEPWILSVKENTGALPIGWVQVAGSNDDTVNVPDQGSVTDYNGFASAAPPTHTVSTSAVNGTINPASKIVNDGDTTTFTITADSGYFIDTATGCGGTLSSSTYTTGVITADCTVTATFSATPPVTHTVSATAGTGGSISPAGRVVNDGNTTTFTVTPDAGYSISTVTGCSGSLSSATYTTGAITADCAVTASFSVIGVTTHTVTATAGTGGSIAPGSASVADGATTTFTVTPNSGYSIGTVSGCGGSLSGATFTTGAITADCAVSASFTAIPPTTYTVNAIAGSGGSIAPGSATVTSGSTTSFTVTPTSGYQIATVSGCGGSLVANTYTTAAIVGNCTVSASFSAVPPTSYTVNAIAGSGGSISPGSRTVDHGSTTTFTVTPNQSYTVNNVTGCSGTLSGNTYTTGTITAACAVIATFSANGPIWGPAPPVSINARSLFTDVPLNIAPTATDGDGSSLKVTLVGPTKYRPGRYTLTWSATDSQGRTMTTTQQLDIWPMVSVSEDLIVGFGKSGDFTVELNGDAPQYPFNVAFTVGGDGGLGILHNLAPATVTIASGTEAGVHFDALPQGTSMPTRHLTVTLDPTANIGERGSLNISLVSENIAPQAEIAVSQASRLGSLVARDGGAITLHAAITDVNPADTHTVQWTYPRNASVQISSNGRDLTLDPMSLSVGLQEFIASVTDSGTPPLSTKARAVLALRASGPTLDGGDTNGNGIPDIVEGWGDSGNGIPTYMDRGTPKNVLPEDAPVTDQYLVEGEPGVQLRIGPFALLTTGGGARLTSTTVTTLMSVDSTTNVGGFFDLEATGLPIGGTSISVVIPQRQPIPKDGAYRLWDPAQSKWYTFIEDGKSRLSSAPGEAGFCPPAGSSAYVPGLVTGNWCVQVTVEEGGPNDADHLKNSALGFSGGVAQKQTSIVTGSSSGGGGGGAMGEFGLILALIALARRFHRQLRRAALLLCTLPIVANAADDSKKDCDLQPVHCSYVGLELALVHNSKGASDMDSRLAAQGYTTQTSLSGQSRLGGALFGGYRWQHIAAELGYEHLGRMDTVIAGTTPVDDAYLHAISLAHPRSGEGPQLSALVFLPLHEHWEVYGRGGFFYWKNTLSAQGFGQFSDAEDRKLDPYFGVGLNLDPMHKKFSARVEVRLFRLDGETLSTFHLGFRYRLPL